MAEHTKDDLPPYEVLQIPVPEALKDKDISEVQEIIARAMEERLARKPPQKELPCSTTKSVFVLPHDFNQRYVGDLIKRAVDEVLRKYIRAASDDSQERSRNHLSSLLRTLVDFYGFEMEAVVPGLKDFLKSMADCHPEDLIRIYAENQRKFRFPLLRTRKRSVLSA